MYEIEILLKDGKRIQLNRVISVLSTEDSLIIVMHGIFGGIESKVVAAALFTKYIVTSGE